MNQKGSVTEISAAPPKGQDRLANGVTNVTDATQHRSAASAPRTDMATLGRVAVPPRVPPVLL